MSSDTSGGHLVDQISDGYVVRLFLIDFTISSVVWLIYVVSSVFFTLDLAVRVVVYGWCMSFFIISTRRRVDNAVWTQKIAHRVHLQSFARRLMIVTNIFYFTLFAVDNIIRDGNAVLWFVVTILVVPVFFLLYLYQVSRVNKRALRVSQQKQTGAR